MRSLTVGQRIVFVDLKNNKQHLDAYVIGTELDSEEGTFFWFFVRETKMVHAAVTRSLYVKDGVEHIDEVDMTRHASDLTERGDAGIFYYSRDAANREAMTKYLKTHMLLV